MATNFLATTGTNGFLTSAAVTALSSGTTTINGVTNASFVVSTAVFTQTDTAHGLLGYVQLTAGSTMAPSSGGYIAGWWLYSDDGGATFESTNTARNPDWTIPLPTSIASVNQKFPTALAGMPWTTFKVLIQNNSGATTGTSGNIISFQSVAVQY